MAAQTINFGTPQPASGQVVHISGTVPKGLTYYESVQVDVTRTDSSHDYYSLTKAYTATAGADLTVNEDVLLAIVPKIETGETIVFKSYGSLVAQIVEA